MPLLNSGLMFARQDLNDMNIVFYDEDGNVDNQKLEDCAKQAEKLYNALFQYICDKLTKGAILQPGSVNGASAIPPGSYSGVVQGNVDVTIM